MATDISENGLEKIIAGYLVETNGYELGKAAEFSKEYALDEGRVLRFLQATQPEKVKAAHIFDNEYERNKFFGCLRKKLGETGVIDLLRNGFRYLVYKFDLYYSTPSEQNPIAKELYGKNIFSVTRQVTYSKEFPRLALDMVIFINGLPVATFELKNQLTKQNTEDAVNQYMNDRDPKELIFNFKRCAVHFAVDDNEVKMCTRLCGKASWFLPFNKGNNDGAGNPPNPNGLKTDYLWREILTKDSLSNIIENYSQVVEKIDRKTNKIVGETMIFPRYHQLTVVRQLLADTLRHEVGKRYLIQHSAGSGKSNSIAWLAYQLVKLEKVGNTIFDSIIVVTDRVNLDKQIRDTIRQFMQEKSVVGWADDSSTLGTLLGAGKKIIITTIHKFPFILKSIGTENKDKKFAIIIDEAHSSQTGSLFAKMNIAVSGNVSEDGEDIEDKINKLIEGHRMVKNANYYAFTATPKNKTLEMFGDAVPQPDGQIRHVAFHTYSMRQAIQERFIMDVLEHYTPVSSFYKIVKRSEDDPLFDNDKAQAKLRAYVEGDRTTIHHKAAIMVEHFHTNVISKGKIGGQARAMVVTSSIERAIDYYFEFCRLLEERGSQYKAIVAFSGEKELPLKYKEYGKMTESSLNGFPSSEIEDRFQKDPYRFLIVANKFQTGYDEPLLHTMYVDKALTDIKAVQTLSRLNRAHPKKRDTFVLDFANHPEDIKTSFQRYYKSTELASETDPNKLNDLIVELEKHQVYVSDDIERLVTLFLGTSDREMIDPILDNCVENYKGLSTDAQVKFKSSAKSFIRTYAFLAAILPFGSAEWEKLSIFLNLLIHKLPTPEGDDYTEGLLDAVDFNSYKNTIQEEQRIILDNEKAEVQPIPVGKSSGIVSPDLQSLTTILEEFNTRFGNIPWTDSDRVRQQIAAIPNEVAQNEAYQNAIRNSDREVARIESDKALMTIILKSMTSGLELYKEYQDNPSFQRWLQEFVFERTYNQAR